jgi:hypothetical protein
MFRAPGVVPGGKRGARVVPAAKKPGMRKWKAKKTGSKPERLSEGAAAPAGSGLRGGRAAASPTAATPHPSSRGIPSTLAGIHETAAAPVLHWQPPAKQAGGVGVSVAAAQLSVRASPPTSRCPARPRPPAELLRELNASNDWMLTEQDDGFSMEDVAGGVEGEGSGSREGGGD